MPSCGGNQPEPRTPGDYAPTPPTPIKGCLSIAQIDPEALGGTGEGSGTGEETATTPPESSTTVQPESCGTDPKPEANKPPAQVFDIRAGGDGAREGVALVACVETLFLGPVSAEICGDGRGLFLDKTDADPTLTWYRARLRLTRMRWGRMWLAPILQAGMTELRVGQSGAQLLPGRGSSRQLALGPAAGAALELVRPLGAGLELIGNIHLDAAWIPRAGELVLAQDELQPTLGATLGIGF